MINEKRLSKRVKKHTPIVIQEYLSKLGDAFAESTLENNIPYKNKIFKFSTDPILIFSIALFDKGGSGENMGQLPRAKAPWLVMSRDANSKITS
jgi:hypothetical protein